MTEQPVFTKRHYVKMASAINKATPCLGTRWFVASHLFKMLETDNEKFDRTRFMDAIFRMEILNDLT